MYIYGCVISGELNLELISIILLLIVNIFHNTHSILFFQIKVFWKSPALKIRTQLSFQMTKTVYLIQNSWLQAVAEIPTLHNFRPPSSFNYANTSRLKLSPSLNWFRILNSTFSRWHIKNHPPSFVKKMCILVEFEAWTMNVEDKTRMTDVKCTSFPVR